MRRSRAIAAAVILCVSPQLIAAPANAKIASTDCTATGSVALYGDATRTEFIDFFRVQALGVRNQGPVHDSYVVTGPDRTPGAEVVGTSGKVYTFTFRSTTTFTGDNTPGEQSTYVVSNEWRVEEEGAGLVSLVRNSGVRVWGEAYSENGYIVNIQREHQPEVGYFLSGGLGINCGS